MQELATVTEYFCQLTGVGTQELPQWTTLCKACLNLMRSKLRPGTDLQDEDTRERVCLACAAEASYRYAILHYGSHAELEFSSSGLSVSVNQQYLRDAEKIRNEMLALCDGLLQDDFTFAAI